MSAPRKVILLGLDGLDPGLVQDMLEAGQLPHMATLARRGAFSRLATSTPPQSPVAWTSIATGAAPETHGVHDFLAREDDGYRPRLTILRQGRLGYVPPFSAPPFWETAADHGLSSRILKWPLTFPARPMSGSLMSGLGTPDLKGTLGRYTIFASDDIPGAGDLKGRFVKVAAVSGRISTELTGPVSLSLKGQAEAGLPLEIEMQDGGVRCALGGRTFALAVGSWSPWISLTFKVGFLRKVKGLCRFRLESLRPEFRLYVTPVNIAPDESSLPLTYPAGYARELAGALGPYATLGLAEDANGLNDEVLGEDGFLAGCADLADERERLFRHELDRFATGEARVLACVFDTCDRVQHMFRRCIDPAHPLYDPEAPPSWREAIADHYRRADAAVGLALERADGQTLVLACSDHGFASFKRAVHLNTWLAANGYMAFKDGAAGSGELFADVDWARTRAYALGLNSIYLNIKGREPQGCVAPAEAPALAGEIAAGLTALADASGPALTSVRPTGTCGQPVPATGPAPDLIAGFAADCRASWQTALGAAPCGAVLEPNLKKWSGDHCCDPDLVPGIFLSSAARAVTDDQRGVRDVILSWLGLDQECGR